MYGFRESLVRRARRPRQEGSLGGKVLSFVAVAGLAGVGAGCTPAAAERPQGIELTPLEPPALESAYVSAFAVPLEDLELLEDSVAVPEPPDEPLAAAFARQYDISPELALSIVEHAVEAGIDPELAFRMVRVESVFRVRARGPQGALGLTQLMPGTARALDRTLDTESEILDPETNLRTGFRYLRQMIDRYDDVRLGLLAYNRGQTSVDRALRRGVDPENGYSHKVLGTRGSTPYAGPGLLAEAPKAQGG